jgi:hypothetical protein
MVILVGTDDRIEHMEARIRGARTTDVVPIPDAPDTPDFPDVPEVLDAARSPDQVAAWARTAPPWDALTTPFGEVRPSALSQAGRVDLLVALERQRSWIDAQQQHLLAVMAADPIQADAQQALDKRWVCEEVACALRVAPVTAAARLALADDLVNRLPATLAALRRGDVSLRHAVVLSDALAPLDDERATVVETSVLTRASGQTPAEFRRTVARAVLTVDARAAEQRHDDAVTQRRVVCTPAPDGMAELWALLPADHAATVLTALDALAHDPALPDPAAWRTAAADSAGAGRGCCDADSEARSAEARSADARSADQRRADALAVLAAHALHCASAGGIASWQGQRPAIQVTVALSTLLGLDDQPADLERHGPIPATLARRLAADPTGTWRRLLTDEHGRLLDCGRTTYRPPNDLRDFVLARDRTCRMPGCHRSAGRCELDHVTSHQRGGPTSEANLHALCPRHHHLKHEAGWTVSRTFDGATRWQSPTGQIHTKPPNPLPIDHTTNAPPPF